MDNQKKLLRKLIENATTHKQELLKKSLWEAFSTMHPVDIADFLCEVDQEMAKKLFMSLPAPEQHEVFKELSHFMKVLVLSCMQEHELAATFESLPPEELTDLFDYLSDEELKRYLNLLHKQVRDKVMSLMQFA